MEIEEMVKDPQFGIWNTVQDDQVNPVSRGVYANGPVCNRMLNHPNGEVRELGYVTLGLVFDAGIETSKHVTRELSSYLQSGNVNEETVAALLGISEGIRTEYLPEVLCAALENYRNR